MGLALWLGQAEAQAAAPEPGLLMPTLYGPTLSPGNSAWWTDQNSFARRGRFVLWLRPWAPDDLQLKPFETVPTFSGCKGLLWCPQKANNGQEERQDAKEGQEKKDTENKESAAKGANGAPAEAQGEQARELAKRPLMQVIQWHCPFHYDRMTKRGDSLYGWIQQGYTSNIDSPRDRVNYGVNFNWRSNDYRLNQLYLVFENPVEHEDQASIGYRVDWVTGHDAPFLVSLGLFSDFTGFDPTSGFGVAGPASYRQMNRVGIDLPQFYLDLHLPNFLTAKGIDIRLGRFYTLMGHEVYPGQDTDFYSRTFENILGTAYTHLGILTTVHATDTWDLAMGIIRGWDVFEDNNDRVSYHHALIWNSCDKRLNWTTTITTGPEQYQNNGNYRTVFTSYLTATFGTYNQWRLATGGLVGVEANAFTDPDTGQVQDAQWYDYSVHLFYTIDPRLILGLRSEWFRDDDGTRAAVFNRPRLNANFFDVTLGLTWKPYQNLRLRPECRLDWTPDARPFNDQTDKFQATAALDMIWEF